MIHLSKTKLTLAIAAIAVSTGAASVSAAGFQLKNQSAEGQGNSFAGQTAKAVDASTIFFNPAGMSLIKGSHIQGNLSYIAPKVKYEHESSSTRHTLAGPIPSSFTETSQDGGVSSFVPAAYAVWDINEDIKMGISINSPYSFSTEYDKDWVGANSNVLSKIKTINIAPTLSYKVNEKFSIGGNIQFQKISTTLSREVFTSASTSETSTLKADDTGLGYSFGMLYQYSDKGRVGFNYRSEINHTLKGDMSFTGVLAAQSRDVSVDITTPAVASLGIYHEVSDQWTLLGDIAWTDWSAFDKLEVKDSTGSVFSTTEYNWKDTVFIATGANYQYNDKLQLKFGLAYDQGAANDTDRTAGIPDETRYWASVGASYKPNKKVTLNAGFSHIRAKEADVETTTRNQTATPGQFVDTTYKGKFKPSENILSLGFDYQF